MVKGMCGCLYAGFLRLLFFFFQCAWVSCHDCLPARETEGGEKGRRREAGGQGQPGPQNEFQYSQSYTARRKPASKNLP